MLHSVGRGGQTNATCWIQHLGSRGLGPKSIQNPWKTNARHIGLPKQMARDRSTVKRCLAALARLKCWKRRMIESLKEERLDTRKSEGEKRDILTI